MPSVGFKVADVEAQAMTATADTATATTAHKAEAGAERALDEAKETQSLAQARLRHNRACISHKRLWLMD